jgi:hypothetical protein
MVHDAFKVLANKRDVPEAIEADQVSWPGATGGFMSSIRYSRERGSAGCSSGVFLPGFFIRR